MIILILNFIYFVWKSELKVVEVNHYCGMYCPGYVGTDGTSCDQWICGGKQYDIYKERIEVMTIH